MDHLGQMKEVQDSTTENMNQIKQAPILVTKENLTNIKNVNQEFNYHGGLTDVELEALKKMLSENIEKVDEVSDTVTEHNNNNEEARANLHI